MLHAVQGVVEVTELTKLFKVPEREAGLRASLGSLVNRKWREVRAALIEQRANERDLSADAQRDGHHGRRDKLRAWFAGGRRSLRAP